MQILGMFTKYWQPGHVMTRLAARVGIHRAAQLQRVCLETLLVRLGHCGDRRVVVFTPESRATDFRSLVTQLDHTGLWQFEHQISGNLGARIEHFFVNRLTSEVDRVVVVGSDCPNMPTEFVLEAFERLAEVPVVLGPCRDGGYYLVAVHTLVPPIFSHSAWGTANVWNATLRALHQADLSYHCLPEWYDIDTVDDLRRLDHDLCRKPATDPELKRLATAVRVALHPT